jgi:hypothetical protein
MTHKESTMTRPNTRSECPIFQEYSTSELADKAPYTELTLIGLKHGSKPITAKFIWVYTKALGRHPLELFGEKYQHLFPKEFRNGEAT